MNKDITKLVKISTYARLKSVSITWIYKQAEANLIELTIIDGVKFVELSEEEIKLTPIGN